MRNIGEMLRLVFTYANRVTVDTEASLLCSADSWIHEYNSCPSRFGGGLERFGGRLMHRKNSAIGAVSAVSSAIVGRSFAPKMT